MQVHLSEVVGLINVSSVLESKEGWYVVAARSVYAADRKQRITHSLPSILLWSRLLAQDDESTVEQHERLCQEALRHVTIGQVDQVNSLAIFISHLLGNADCLQQLLFRLLHP